MRTQEVLCPTDFSATAAHALKYAVEMANLYQVDIRLLHVVSPARSAHFYGVAVETPASLEQKLAEFVAEKMQSLQQDMQQGLKSGLSINALFATVRRVRKFLLKPLMWGWWSLPAMAAVG